MNPPPQPPPSHSGPASSGGAATGYSHTEYQDAAAATAAAALSQGGQQHSGSYSPPAGLPGSQYAPPVSQPYGTQPSGLQQSQQHIPTPSAQAAGIGNGRKRKASGVPGSRGVANLTPDQLAKKRANDREAQRAIRERTRNTIETLETRIKELESQQPFQELQRVVQELDRALQECDDLRRKLAQVASVAAGAQQQQQPNLHGTFDVIAEYLEPKWLTDEPSELAALTAQQSPLPPFSNNNNSQHPPSQHQSPQTSGAPQPPFEQQMLHPDLRSPHASSQSQAGASSRTATPVTYHGEPPPRKWSPSTEQQREQGAQYPTSNGMSYEHHHRPSPAPIHSHSNGERLGVNFLLDQKPPSNPPSRAPSRPYTPQRTPEPPIWARLPSHSPYDSPLDSLLGEFVVNCRQQLAKGIPMREVIGPEDPSFTALLNPDPARRDSCHPLSALLIDILSKFPAISASPEKVAVLYLMALTLRWMICPCETCYYRLPEWIRAIPEQIERPHPAWIDHLPW